MKRIETLECLAMYIEKDRLLIYSIVYYEITTCIVDRHDKNVCINKKDKKQEKPKKGTMRTLI